MLTLALAFAGSAHGMSGPFEVSHDLPGLVVWGESLSLEASVTQGVEIVDAMLCLREKDRVEQELRCHPMQIAGERLTVTLPPDEVPTGEWGYYIEATAGRGEVARSPRGAPAVMYQVKTRGGGVTDLHVLAPEQDGVVPGTDAYIAVMFDPPLGPEDEVVLILDGRDVTDTSELTPDYVLYTPATPPADGRHLARVAVSRPGFPPAVTTWSFDVGMAAPPASLAVGKAITEPRLSLNGRARLGWSVSEADDTSGEDDQSYEYYAYLETSDLLADGLVYGQALGATYSGSVSKWPLYDRKTRARLTLDWPGLRVGAGNLMVNFNDETVSWLQGDGLFARYHHGRWETDVTGLRASEADDAAGLYARYLWAGRLATRLDYLELGVVGMQALDHESSIPDHLKLYDAYRNSVISIDVSHPLGGGAKVKAVAAGSDLEAEEPSRGAAGSLELTLVRPSGRSLRLELHSYESGYSTLGNTALNPGESAFVAEGGGSILGSLSGNLRLKVHRDDSPSLEWSPGSLGREYHLRSDFRTSASNGSRGAYLAISGSHVPYAQNTYEMTSVSGGIFSHRGMLSGSLSCGYTRSSWDVTSEYLTLSAFIGIKLLGDHLEVKLNANRSEGSDDQDTMDFARTSWEAQATGAVGRWEVRAQLIRVDHADKVTSSASYTQDAVSFSVGNAF